MKKSEQEYRKLPKTFENYEKECEEKGIEPGSPESNELLKKYVESNTKTD